MKQTALGATGGPVSAVCLGRMCFGTRLDEPTAYRLADAYFDAEGLAAALTMAGEGRAPGTSPGE